HFLQYSADVDEGAAHLFGNSQFASLSVHSRAVDGVDTADAAADGDVFILVSHDRVSLSLITAIVARDVIGASNGCNYSGTIQLTVACPVPAGTSLLCSHGSTLFICCSSFHGGLITIMPEAVMPRRSLSGSTASSICRILRIPVASRSWIMRLIC